MKISADLLSNPLCEQDQAFLESMNALDTAMRRMDSFNQEKVRLDPTVFLTSIFLRVSHSSTVVFVYVACTIGPSIIRLIDFRGSVFSVLQPSLL